MGDNDVMSARIRPADDWRKTRLLEWLTTAPDDRMPATMKLLAEELSVDAMTLSKWKRDPEFLVAWEERYRRTIGSPERLQRVLDQLYETATDRTDPRQVQAAKAYVEQVQGARPQRVDVTVTGRAAKDLPDDELYALLAERAAQELERRGG